MIVRIEKLVYNGYGLGRGEDGLVVFVPYTAPGDLVRVRITERKRDFAFAVVEELLQESPHRVSPQCPHFGQCGSCQWLHVEYKVQLQAKEEILKRELKSLAHAVEPIEYGPSLGYRRRALLFVENKLIGFRGFRTNRLVPVGNCPLLTDDMNRALLVLYRFQSVLKKAKEVWMGEDKDASCLLIDISATAKVRDIHEIFHQLKETLETDVGLRIRYAGKRSRLGKEFLTEELCGAKVRYTFNSFFQANRFMVEDLVNKVLELVPEGSRVLELFAGCGTFTLPLSKRTESVIAVEANKGACDLLRERAERQGIKNLNVVNADADRFTAEFSDAVDVILLDPPRTGCTPELVKAISKVNPEYVIYVSCNPTTLARDLRRFSNYSLVSVKPLDMFPNTFHLESVAFLKRTG